MKKKLFLIDISSLIFRAFYAVRPLSSPSGTPTNALFGVFSMILKLMKDEKPEYMVFCFDRKEPSFRKELYSEYKAHRTEMPEDLVPQMPYFRKMAEALGILCLEAPGFEADDIIGTLTKIGSRHQMEIDIVSGDKDFGQLITDHIYLVDTMKNLKLNAAGVKEKWGIPPEQFIDYLALVGDTSDNIPGVTGVGPKGAQKLLEEFGSLENIYENIDKVTAKALKEKLIRDKEQAFLSKKLVTIATDIPLPDEVSNYKMQGLQWNLLNAFLEELGFKNFDKTLQALDSKNAQNTQATLDLQNPKESNDNKNTFLRQDNQGIQSSLKNLTSEFGENHSSNLSDNLADGKSDSQNQNKNLSATNSLSNNLSENLTGKLTGNLDKNHNGNLTANPVMNLATNDSTNAFLISETVHKKFQNLHYEEIDVADMDKNISPLLEKNHHEIWGLELNGGILLGLEHSGHLFRIQGDPTQVGLWSCDKKNINWLGFDLKSFWHFIRFGPVNHSSHIYIHNLNSANGPFVKWDSLLAAYVVRPGESQEYARVFTKFMAQMPAELPSPQEHFMNHLSLKQELTKQVEFVHGMKVLTELDLPIAPILYNMERTGILLDTPALHQQSKELAHDILQIEKNIFDLAGEVFNIASPKQLGQILFTKLNLPVGKKTKTGFSTDEDVLLKLKSVHPIASHVLDFRELTKLKSTYVDSLPNLVGPDGRIHSNFRQALTTTGRLSSSEPNLQNIPIRTDKGARIRRAFIAGKGQKLLSADYSQIELRILAHYSKDAGLTEAFQNNIDIHTRTASEVFGVNLSDVTADMRRTAKAVNFGIAYGQGAFGLAETLGISRSESSEIIKKYFTRFPGVKNYIEDTIQFAKENGYVETLYGRRRYIDEIKSRNAAIQKFGERAAINAPMQGTASDIVKKSMIECAKKISLNLLLQVHDELIFEGTAEIIETEINSVTKTMESVAELSVPLKVNAAFGNNWDEIH